MTLENKKRTKGLIFTKYVSEFLLILQTLLFFMAPSLNNCLLQAVNEAKKLFWDKKQGKVWYWLALNATE